jgi:hypothetical protein
MLIYSKVDLIGYSVSYCSRHSGVIRTQKSYVNLIQIFQNKCLNVVTGTVSVVSKLQTGRPGFDPRQRQRDFFSPGSVPDQL